VRVNWSRIPGVDIFAANMLEHATPRVLLLWSSWDGEWHTATDAGTRSMDTNDLYLWLGLAFVPVPSADDLAWLQG
jgi:hypothetical protein